MNGEVTASIVLVDRDPSARWRRWTWTVRLFGPAGGTVSGRSFTEAGARRRGHAARDFMHGGKQSVVAS